MSQPTENEGRRRFLKIAVVGVAVAPVAASLLPRLARAQDLPHLEETDPTAMALGYKNDATKVDKAKYAQFKAGEDCSNCKFWGTPKAGDQWASCQLFPGKDTHQSGWCAGYAAKV